VPLASKLSVPSAPRRKGEVTAARILDAAEELFAERGYEGTTLRDVAARVGLRIPSLYNHFESKEALYAAVLERGFGPVLALLDEVVTAAAARRLDSGEMVDRVMQLLAEHPALPSLILHETLAGGPRLTPMLRTWIGPAFARAAELVEATPSSRAWPAELVPLLVLAMYHVVVGYYTIAPLYRDLAGVDLLAESMLEQQTRLLRRIVDALFPPEAPGPATH
jgi:TetR/AcrR family transcriptional regulator